MSASCANSYTAQFCSPFVWMRPSTLVVCLQLPWSHLWWSLDMISACLSWPQHHGVNTSKQLSALGPPQSLMTILMQSLFTRYEQGGEKLGSTCHLFVLSCSPNSWWFPILQRQLNEEFLPHFLGFHFKGQKILIPPSSLIYIAVACSYPWSEGTYASLSFQLLRFQGRSDRCTLHSAHTRAANALNYS